ncbi:MAG TPA: AsnC family transcriptional regulator [Streptosporangiaceae bacterium]|nr:AsnC family transcriptional regulator [Streptosporangiaceae bacterium]
MKAFSLDLLDKQIIQALFIDGRVPFSRIATVTGVSEQTVARRYRRMRAADVVRVTGIPDTALLGHSEWVVRLQCVPDAAAAVAGALARRPDTFWVQLMSGGTEIGCVVKPTDGSPDDLLLRQLPASRRIVAISAHLLLHMFRGNTEHWAGASMSLTAEQAAALSAGAASGNGDRAAAHGLGPGDRVLLAELARDGRASYAELAHATHWHESTVRRRLEDLRAAGLLYLDVDVDEAAFGITTRAHLWMSVAPARLVAVGEAMAQHTEIPFVAATTGASNLMASVLCRDDEALYRYLTERIASLDGVTALEVAPIMRTAKRTATVRMLPASA